MSSVTQRIKEIRQPRGGYLSPKLFEEIKFTDVNELNPVENKHASSVGLVVDYMSRYMLTKDFYEAFKVSFWGAINKDKLMDQGGENKARCFEIGAKVKGIDNESLKAAYQIVGYDVWYRNPDIAYAKRYCGDNIDLYVEPDDATLENTRIMINRAIRFFKMYGPLTKDGLTFEDDGYTETVDTGDGDFLTKDTLWDFKVSNKGPTTAHTLQLMMYYIMGLHSGQEIYKDIRNLGIYNPRLNAVYIYPVKDIPKETIDTIEKEVICYE